MQYSSELNQLCKGPQKYKKGVTLKGKVKAPYKMLFVVFGIAPIVGGRSGFWFGLVWIFFLFILF